MKSVPENLQKHWAFQGARMEARHSYKGQTYFLADGGPHFDAKGIVDKEDGWMNDGYYLSVWGLQKGKAVMGYSCYFKLNHNLELDDTQRRQTRLNEAKDCAERGIDSLLERGLIER